MSELDDALDRLDTKYNGNGYDPTTNPGGMDNGGHTVNFIPSLRDVATSGKGMVDSVNTAVAAAATATTKASEASASAVLAATSKTDAEAARDAAAASASEAGFAATIDGFGTEPGVVATGAGTAGTSESVSRGDHSHDLNVSKSDVGLGNCDNTSDANKPVSTEQQNALNAKVNNSLVTAAGDLVTASAANTPSRLGIGAVGQVLTPLSGVLGWGEAPIGGECRLDYTSATVLTLSRYSGYRLVIDNVTRVIPAAGVTLANTGVANTLYYIYAYWTGSAIALACDTTGYTVDSRNGVQVKNGDATRTLVGMARTNASGQWVDSYTQKFVLSWYNQRIFVVNATLGSNFSTSSTSAVATGASSEFLCWGGPMLQNVSVFGLGANSAANAAFHTSLYLDGTSIAATLEYSHVANYYVTCFSNSYVLVSQGYHLATIRVQVATGTATWGAGNTGSFVNLLG